MSPKTPVSLAACERLRNHQAATNKAMSVYAAAIARSDAITSRRAEIISGQDAMVAAASADVDVAIAAIAEIVGVETTSGLLELGKAEVRRAAKVVS